MGVRQLLVWLRQLPDDSAVARSQDPEAAEWGAAEHLLAGVFDALQMGNWQRGEGKGQRPSPLPRPGVKQQRRHGQTTLPREEALAILRPDREVTDGD